MDVLEAHRDALANQLVLLNQHFKAIENKIGVYRALLAEGEQALQVK